MTLQSIVFMTTDGWTASRARQWLRQHNKTPIKQVHKKGKELRYRISQPTYKKYYTKKIEKGVMYVIGINK